MDRIKRLVTSILLAAAMAAFVLPTSMAQAGTSFIYFQACQGEGPSTTPAVPNTQTDASNGQPYCVMDFTTTTADTAYYHFVVPNDFSAANSSGAVTAVVQAFPETDTVTSHVTCFKYSVAVFTASSNYRTDAIPAVGGTAGGLGLTEQYGFPSAGIATTSGLSFIDVQTGAACASTTCNNRQAVMKAQRVACPALTDWTGAAGVTDFYLTYSN